MTKPKQSGYTIEIKQDKSKKNYRSKDIIEEQIELAKDRYDILNTCFENSNPILKEDFKNQIKRAKESSDLTFKKPVRISKKVEKPTTLKHTGANSTLMEQSVGRLITINNEKLTNLLIDDLLIEIVTQLNHFEADIGKRGMEQEIVHFAKDFLKELEDLTETQKRLLVPGYETCYHPVSLSKRIENNRDAHEVNQLVHFGRNEATKYQREKRQYLDDLSRDKVRSQGFWCPKVYGVGVKLYVEPGLIEFQKESTMVESRSRTNEPIYMPNYLKAVEIVSEEIIEDLEDEIYGEFYAIQEGFMKEVVEGEFGIKEQEHSTNWY